VEDCSVVAASTNQRENNQGWINGEPFYQGRSATAWRRGLRNPDEVAANAATQALAAGGGISELGSEWRIEIRRRLPTGEIVEGPASLDDKVLPDDTVVVNERWF